MSLIIHKCFDDVLITINQDYKIVLSSKIKNVELLNYLSKYNGVKKNLPIKKEFDPDKKLLLLRNDKVFKG